MFISNRDDNVWSEICLGSKIVAELTAELCIPPQTMLFVFVFEYICAHVYVIKSGQQNGKPMSM